MADDPEYHDELKRILDRDYEMRERLPVRVPGYPEPMVPFTLQERDELVRALTDAELERTRNPIVFETDDPDLDAELAAIEPEALRNRKPVNLPGYGASMVVLTIRERDRIVSGMLRLAQRIRELGDSRGLRELMLRDDTPDDRMTKVFTNIIFETMGLAAVPQMIEDVIEQLERTNSPENHAEANALREIAERLRAADKRATTSDHH